MPVRCCSPAGLTMFAVSALLIVRLRRPAQAISAVRMAEEEAWSDLAAMEESIHGEDDVRTSLAPPYLLKLFARRARVVLERGRPVWSSSARLTLRSAISCASTAFGSPCRLPLSEIEDALARTNHMPLG